MDHHSGYIWCVDLTITSVPLAIDTRAGNGLEMPMQTAVLSVL